MPVRWQHSWDNFAQATPRWGIARFELGKLRGWRVDVFVWCWYVWCD